MSKNFLFVMSRPPHGSLHAQETLDIILTSAAFDQHVSLLFLDDGVFQLKKGLNPEPINLKNIAPIYQSLEIYDVHDMFVEEESILERGLSQTDFFLPTKSIPRKQLAKLMSEQHVIFGC